MSYFTSKDDLKKINFHFHPFQFEQGLFAVEKQEGDKKQRYLQGVSSGIKVDGHGERMTENCIKSFMGQANSGDILLYPDVHGIKSSEDIGILHKAEILPNGDWFTQYKLYSEEDLDPKVHSNTFATIDKLWKQLNGIKPYTRKKQKGFSIEGSIPEDTGIIEMDATGKRAINDVQLDGVVIVPRPAYRDSIINSVYKTLDEIPYWQEEKTQGIIKGKLDSIIADTKLQDNYNVSKYDLEWALEDEVENIMRDKKLYKSERLNIIFDEFKNKMVNIITKSTSLFTSDKEDKYKGSQERTTEVFNQLGKSFEMLKKSIKEI